MLEKQKFYDALTDLGRSVYILSSSVMCNNSVYADTVESVVDALDRSYVLLHKINGSELPKNKIMRLLSYVTCDINDVIAEIRVIDPNVEDTDDVDNGDEDTDEDEDENTEDSEQDDEELPEDTDSFGDSFGTKKRGLRCLR